VNSVPRRPARFGILSVLFAVVASSPAPAAPPIGDAPRWVSLRHAWVEARNAFHDARWNESAETLAGAERRLASAESLYVQSLRAWTPDASALRVPIPDLRGAALDLFGTSGPAAEGDRARAELILEGALRDDGPLLPLRAAALARSGRAALGLALLQWPPDRPPVRGEAARARAPRASRDLASLLVTVRLADSLKEARAARAALWTLLNSRAAGPAARDLARRALARRLVDEGTPRLAIDVLGTPTAGDQAVLLGEAYAAALDTLGAVEALHRYGTREGVALSERFPAIRRAAEWASARPGGAAERTVVDLCRTLGEVGDADRGLKLLAARRRAVPDVDSDAALIRLETEAGLLARARRHADAMSAYRAVAAHPALPVGSRAKTALAYARAARGARVFAVMDSAFLAAVALDSAGATGETAAWERAREWEDQRTARESAAVFAWARRYLRGASFRVASHVHEALAWKRAGAADTALSVLAAGPANEAPIAFWRARLAEGTAGLGATRQGMQRTVELSPLTYEGVRAREELVALGAPVVDDASGRPTRPDSKGASRRARASDVAAMEAATLEERVLEALGFEAIALDRLKACAREGETARALACTNRLEEEGFFRVGQRSLVPEGRLDFPPAYPNEVLRAAEAESVSASLLWAIMRTESAYDRRARSKAGAIGLLQLMPATANQWAGRSVPEDSLADPRLNVTLAARYVRALLREFGDARAVMASYNAGEDAVRRWRRDNGATIDDEWVERIPYRETRDYVKQVYATWRRYESLYGAAVREKPPAP
jgi:soluble lytic murein transglycosylase-like protein